MKERIVYLGPFNNKKKEELIDKAIDYLKENRGEEFYYLLPNGELLKKYRQYFIDRVENTFEINVFTFDDIVNKILKGDLRPTIDNPMKNLILRRALDSLILEGKLSYYKDLIDIKGFVHSLNDIIGEIKRSLIYPEDYLNNCPNKPSFKEIGFIYKRYEEILKEFNLRDREGAYFKSIELLKENNFLKDLKFIIIDEFYDFRPIELAILKELIDDDLSIYINMAFDMENRSPVLSETLDTLKSLGFTIEYIEKEERNLFEEIGAKLFSQHKEIFSFTDKIKLINAPTAYLELRRIFEEIKRIHKNGTSLEDIGLILTNPAYSQSLFKVSQEEEIPISIDRTTILKNLPIAREILGILENRISNGNKFKLINRIKSKYFKICSDGKREVYELIIRKLNFKNIHEMKALLDGNTTLNMSEEYLKDLKDIVHIIAEEIHHIPMKDTIENYNEYILHSFNEFNLMENILKRYKRTKDKSLLLRDMASINKIKEILDIMESISLLDEEIALEDYYSLLEEYFEEESIIEEEGNPKGVHILNPVNSRGIVKDTIFITGLSQGNYPSLESGNYFINEDNLKELRSIGVNIKSYMESLNNEILKFASMITSCKNNLYLSYNRGNTDVGLPSMFLDELLDLFIKNKDKKVLEEIYINLDYLIKKDINEITNIRDLRKYLLYRYYNEDEMDIGLYELKGKIDKEISLINKKIQGEFNRSKEEFNEYKGFIGDEIINKDIKNNINKSFSISYLESYSSCPYSFMLNNLFNIEPMEREYEDYNPMDIGNIYHESLRHYYIKYQEDIKEYILENKEFNMEDTEEFLRKMVYDYGVQYELDLNLKKDELILENIIIRLMEFIEKDLERMVKYKLLPYKFEVDFGKKPGFSIKDDDKEISMIGRIDRIDKFIEEDKYVIIDYKSSSFGIRDIDDMKIALSLQLPVYIMSQRDKDVVAGAYGIINDGSLEVKLGLVEETNILTKRNKGALSREEWDELMKLTEKNIINIVENIKKGDFSINPLECSNYCPYMDICRYEDRLEVQ